MKKPLQQLADLGQSVWIDYLSRDLVQSGQLERLVHDDAVVGVTSNPCARMSSRICSRISRQ